MKNKKSLYAFDEFKKENLPATRKALFGDVLKLHYFSLTKLGLVLFAFFLPILVINLFKGYTLIVANEEGYSPNAILLTLSLVEIPFFLLLTIPISGCGRILREYAFMEPVFFKDDFVLGIKTNSKPTFISVLLITILHLIYSFVRIYSTSGWLMAIPFGFDVVVFFPIFMHTLYINFMYTNKYFQNLKLGIFFYIKHLPSTILSILLLLLPLSISLFDFTSMLMVYTEFFIYIIFIIFIVPMIIFGIQLNEMRLFDLHINAKRFVELINKGLYRPKKEAEKE